MLVMVSKNCPIIAEQIVIIFATQQVTIAIVRPAKYTLNFSFKYFSKVVKNFGHRVQSHLKFSEL